MIFDVPVKFKLGDADRKYMEDRRTRDSEYVAKLIESGTFGVLSDATERQVLEAPKYVPNTPVTKPLVDRKKIRKYKKKKPLLPVLVTCPKKLTNINFKEVKTLYDEACANEVFPKGFIMGKCVQIAAAGTSIQDLFDGYPASRIVSSSSYAFCHRNIIKVTNKTYQPGLHGIEDKVTQPFLPPQYYLSSVFENSVISTSKYEQESKVSATRNPRRTNNKETTRLIVKKILHKGLSVSVPNDAICDALRDFVAIATCIRNSPPVTVGYTAGSFITTKGQDNLLRKIVALRSGLIMWIVARDGVMDPEGKLANYLRNIQVVPKKCWDPFRKLLFFGTHLLDEHSIDYDIIIQNPGEILFLEQGVLAQGICSKNSVMDTLPFCWKSPCIRKRQYTTISGGNVGTKITPKKRKLNNTEPNDDDDEVNDAELTGNNVSFGGEMTPTHELTAIPKMTDPSITFTPKQPLNEDLFVLKTWGLVKNENFLEKERERISKEVYSEIVNLLSGIKRFENTMDLITFLQMQPQCLVGKFIVAILIVDFCVSAPVQQVLELYNNKCSEMLIGYKVIIENLALLSLHRALRINKDQLELLADNSIPYNLMMQVDAKSVLQSTDSNHLILTSVESRQASWIRTLLNELCWAVDKNLKQPNLLDPNFEGMKRLSAWTRLVEAAFVKLDDTNKSLFDELLLMELKLKQSTCCYFIATNDKVQSEVHFHPEVLRRFTDKMPETRQHVTASPKEIKLLTDMLYFPSKDIPNFENKIKSNLVDMAKKLNIKNVFQFIFNKHGKVQETKDDH